MTTTRPGTRERSIGRWTFALALVVYFATSGGSLTTTDAVVTFDVTRNLVEHHTVAMSGNLLGIEAERGIDGRYYSPFGIAQSIYNVPFYLAGRTAVRWSGLHLGKPDTVPKACVALGQTLLAAFVVHQTYYLALAVTGDAIAALLSAITLAFGSILWPYARFGFNQPLACAALTASANAAVRSGGSRRGLFVAGFWQAVSLLTRHEMMIAAVPMAGWILWRVAGPWRARIAALGAYGSVATIGLVVWLWLNYVRFGNPLDTGLLGDPTPGLGSPIVPGLIGLLFSPSTSVLLYSPFALFGLLGLVGAAADRRWRRDGLLLLSWFVVFLLFYASLANWIGGRSYGSRYLVVVLPCLACGWAVVLARLTARGRRRAFVAVMAVGTCLQLPGVLVDYAKASQAAQVREHFSTEQRQWAWRASSLALNTSAMLDRVPENLAYLAGWQSPPPLAPPRADDDRGFSQQFDFSLDLWWLYLFYLGRLSRFALALVVGSLGGATAVCIAKVSRAAVTNPAVRRQIRNHGGSGPP